jgi:hypothetical protein
MLAYDLYYRNKDKRGNVTRSLRENPIKKIYVEQDTIKIDSKTLEEYGSKISDRYRILQESLIMPLDTSDGMRLNLPDNSSTSQPHPYIKIYGTLKKVKSKSGLLLKLSIQTKITDRESLLEAEYDLMSDKQSIKAEKDIPLRIDAQNYYFISNENGEEIKVNVFKKYVESGILTESSIFSKELFTRIADTFYRFTKEGGLEMVKHGSLPFLIYLLPSDSKIEYHNKKESSLEENKKKNQNSFTDSFGNLVTGYSFNPTINAKFLSFDEKAFTLNCKQRDDFYQNIGIGEESLKHIFLPADQFFTIGGLKWLFMDLNNVYQEKFNDTRQGIISQLYQNFKTLDSLGKTRVEKSLLKIICLRVQQSKQEILIDDNLTMDRLRRIFSNLDSITIPHMAFEEALIYKDGKVVLRNDYLYGIKSFLSETKISKTYLITSFRRTLKRRIFDWIEKDEKTRGSDNDAAEFFKAADFCLKTLSIRHEVDEDMSNNEVFAYNIGAIARLYIDFKNAAGEKSSSLRDILVYSKYDREKLQFVYRRIGQSINLSKAKEDKKREITKQLEKYTPHDEIGDQDAFDDYSYFFYKGYFQRGSDTK